MSSAAEILVIIVSIVLAVFLIIAIILFVYLWRLTVEIKKLAVSAQNTVNHIEQTVAQVHNMMTPLALLQIVRRSVHSIRNKKGKSHGKISKSE